MQPMYTVERLSVKHLLATLNPHYELPLRKHFSEDELPKLYNHVRDSITCMKPKLMQAEHFSATTELCTSSNTVQFMSLTVHFVDSKWSLWSFCFATFPLYENHTRENLSKAVSDVLAH